MAELNICTLHVRLHKTSAFKFQLSLSLILTKYHLSTVRLLNITDLD